MPSPPGALDCKNWVGGCKLRPMICILWNFVFTVVLSLYDYGIFSSMHAALHAGDTIIIIICSVLTGGSTADADDG